MIEIIVFTLKYHFKSIHFSLFVQAFFQAVIYTLLNISAELRCLYFRFPLLFQKLHAEKFSKLLSF